QCGRQSDSRQRRNLRGRKCSHWQNVWSQHCSWTGSGALAACTRAILGRSRRCRLVSGHEVKSTTQKPKCLRLGEWRWPLGNHAAVSRRSDCHARSSRRHFFRSTRQRSTWRRALGGRWVTARIGPHHSPGPITVRPAQKTGAERIIVVVGSANGPETFRELQATRRLPASVELVEAAEMSLSHLLSELETTFNPERLLIIEGNRTYHPILFRQADEWTGEQ